jgi:hypothetical protein
MAWWTATLTLRELAQWPLAVWLLIVGVAAVIGVVKQRLPLRRVLYASAPFVFSVAIILVGVVFNNPSGQRVAIASLAPVLLLILLAAQLALSVILVWRFSGCRIFTAAMSLGGLWVSLLGAFISAMSVTGDWL